MILDADRVVPLDVRGRPYNRTLLLASMEVIVQRMEIRATVLEPHGQNANWSDIACKYGGQRREG